MKKVKEKEPGWGKDVDSRRLIHELEVHQIELEMQNEELTQARSEVDALLEQFKNLYDFAPVGYLTLAKNGTISQSNLAAAGLLGCVRGELIGQRLALFVSSESHVVFSGFFQRIFTSENKESSEVALLKKDGKRIWVQMQGIGGEQNGTCRITATDITIRKKAEEDSERLAAIVASSDDAIIGKTLEGIVTSWNLGAEKLYGYSASEAIGRSILFLAPPELPYEITEILSHIKSGEVVEHLETQQVRKDGNLLDVSITVSPVLDANGVVIGASNISRDITDRKLAEQELRKLGRIVEQSPSIIMITNKNGDIEYVNPKFTEVTGYTFEESINRNSRFLKSGYTTAQEYKKLWDTITAGGEWQGEFHNRKKDGGLYWEAARILPLWNDQNEITHYLAVKENITERRQAEDRVRQLNADLEERVEERTIELVHANHAKDEFLANMSHELRTPLNAILGLSEILLEGIRGPMAGRQIQAIEIIQSSGEHLLSLINDILDVSKIEAGKFDIHPELVPVNDICQSSLSFIKEMAHKKSITVEYSPFPVTPLLFADSRRLKQILVNLLTNAVKFTPEHGSVKLELDAAAESGFMRFSVQDTGIGIAQENLQRIFNPFEQLDGGLSRQNQGTGLGLTLVKQLVDMHNGSLEVQSQPGIGSRFSFILLWDGKYQEILPHRTRRSESSQRAKSISGGKILIAEDNEANILVTRDYLESCGYQVFSAHDGREVLAMAGEVSPDIILMDIQMPYLNGFDAIRHLRANPRFASVPIIALTAFAMPGDRERCLESGANEYISKPVELKKLSQLVESLLRTARG